MKYLSSEIIFKALCAIMIGFQALVLNKFLVIYRGNLYWCWFIADVFVILSLPLIHHFSGSKLKERLEKGDHNPNKDRKPDSIKFVYITWLIYAAFLSAKVIILFYKHAAEIEREGTYGKNGLIVSVAITPLIFMFLINGHHNGKDYIKRKFYISCLVATVSLDLFDSIEILEYLFIPLESRPFSQSFADAILSFSSLNFYLPAIALFELRINQFSGRTPSLIFKGIYTFTVVFLINVPNLVMRSILWHNHGAEVSVLLMKNVIAIVLGVHELYELLKDRPAKCEHCGLWFHRKELSKHQSEVHGIEVNGRVVNINTRT